MNVPLKQPTGLCSGALNFLPGKSPCALFVDIESRETVYEATAVQKGDEWLRSDGRET